MNIEQLKYLSSLGMTLEQVIELQAMGDVAKPRSANAERQARHRQRIKESVTDNVTSNAESNATGNVSAPLSLPPNEYISTPPTHTPEIIKPARVRGHRLPTDWQPTSLPADLAAAVKFWPSKALDREMSRFRDWAASATGPNAVKLDWQAAWRNWVRKAEDEGRYGRSVGPPGAVVDDLAARILKRQSAENVR